MVNEGVLPLLQRLLMELGGLMELRPLIARILANLALSPSLHKHIIRGGE